MPFDLETSEVSHPYIYYYERFIGTTQCQLTTTTKDTTCIHIYSCIYIYIYILIDNNYNHAA